MRLFQCRADRVSRNDRDDDLPRVEGQERDHADSERLCERHAVGAFVYREPDRTEEIADNKTEDQTRELPQDPDGRCFFRYLQLPHFLNFNVHVITGQTVPGSGLPVFSLLKV